MASSHSRVPGLFSALALVLSLLAVLLVLRPSEARADGPPTGPRHYDDGVEMYGPVGGDDDLVTAQVIRFFTDCAPGDFGACGGPPGRWTAERIPVTFCSFQTNRPSSISAQQLRDAITAAARMWNATEVGVGVRYEGECLTGLRWESSDGKNQIGFDDSRRAIAGSTAALARGSWSNVPRFGPVQERQFNEFDIILDSRLNVSDACLRSILAHEIGHALGLGHSDDPRDLMYATFNPADPNGCRATATSAERSRMAELYGVNRAPAVSLDGPRTVFVDTSVTVTAVVSDPEGDPVTLSWAQTAGPAVQLTTDGPTARFRAPAGASAPVVLQVTAVDPYLHESTATISIIVDLASRPPTTIPALESFGPSSGSAVLGWESVADAASYRLCLDEACETVASPIVPITWKVVLGAAGDPAQRRVITSGIRATSLAACNSTGCSRAGGGPRAAGLLWSSWGIDFDVIGMAYDVPAVGIRFTIGGVVNQSTTPRQFLIYAGTLDDPLARLVQNCGNVVAKAVCFGLLTPSQGGHESLVTIVSQRPGTPTTEHRIEIR